MPDPKYYEYKGKIDRVLCHVNNVNNKIDIYFKIDKKDIIVRDKLRYIVCITCNDYTKEILEKIPKKNLKKIPKETPSAKLCSLCDINSDYYLRISVPLNVNNAQSLKPGVNLEVVFKSEENPTSDNTAELITFTNDADAF